MNGIKNSLALLAVLVLAACGGSAPKQPTATAVLPAPANPVPEVEKPAKTVQPVAPPPKQAALPKPPEPEPVDDNPMQFMEMTVAQLSEAIGRPHLVRRDGGAEVWQYRGEGCFLDVFLYQQDGVFRVKYVDLRSPTLNKAQLRPCLAGIIRARVHTKPVG